MSDSKRGKAKSGLANRNAPIAVPTPEAPEAVKLALLLPEKAPLRILRRATELAAGLIESYAERGEVLEVAIGLAEPDDRRWRRGETLIRQRAPSVVVRHLAWTAVPVGNAKRMFADIDPALDLEGIENVMVPRDWGWNFQDCSLWLCLADPGIGPILPLRPIVYYNMGLPERYVPQMVAQSIHDPYWTRQVEAFRMWRQATVVTSDPTAMADLVSYAGVRSERTELIPDVLATLAPLAQLPEAQRDRETIVWAIDGSAVDDLEACLSGLQVYYREGGALEVIVAEEENVAAGGHPAAAALPADLSELYASLSRVTYRSLDEFDRLLARSGALWPSQIAGGCDHLFEAERAGLHLLAASFPLSRQIVEERALSAILYPPSDALAIADALKAVEDIAAAPPAARDSHDEAGRHSETFAFLLDWLLAMTRAR